MQTCPAGMFADLVSLVCTCSCKPNTYADTTTNTCANICPVPYFGNII